MATIKKEEVLYCSFCGKSQNEVKKLIAGPKVWICCECIDLCNEIIRDESSETDETASKGDNIPTPKDIIAKLDVHVIGQRRAKESLAIGAYDHFKRMQSLFLKKKRTESDVEIAKSNILLIGPTGSGKTLLAQMLARALNVPFVIANATTLTEAGYVGDDVESIIQKLLVACDYDVAKAERGVVYIDEIDKVARKSQDSSATRDVSGEGVQNGLLKLVEGTMASVPPKGGRRSGQDAIEVDTTNILFICGGAFGGLDQIIAMRTQKTSIGFHATVRSKESMGVGVLLTQVQPEDLIKFGIIPELIGRLPVVATLEELDVAALLKILVEPQHALVKQEQKLFAMDGIALEFTHEALEEIAKLAIVRKTGARGLRTIVEDVLRLPKINAPSDNKIEKVVVTKASVLGEDAVEYHFKQEIPLLSVSDKK